jgi:N-methylhydantoinase A/oxoprolinase/acetone carboxylase beta subunit
VRRVGVDTGGTFTDVVTDDGVIAKVPSTSSDPSSAVASGVHAVSGVGGVGVLCHGTTVATNALLERRGGRVALVTTEGFSDVIEIARQRRPSLYDQWADRPAPLVPRSLRFEVRERLDASGAVIVEVGGDGEPTSLESLSSVADRIAAAAAEIDCVAVCLLHADLEPAHERAVAAVLRDRGFDVTCSHEISPEFREYERIVTTVANAYLRPVCGQYLSGLTSLADQVLVLSSAAGLMALDEAGARPVSLLLSGPAGGVLAASAAAVAAGFPDVITFDMGGTSTDVCLVLGGEPEPAAQRSVAGLAVRQPALDVHTIGAGGGSIARIDAGGALVVGPRSAGAVPGPACYGLGGAEATVTDADLVAGRIAVDASFPGLGALDADASLAALAAAGVTAADVIAVVDAAMEQALRVVSVERGVDPRGLALVAFGGAGPLHACALAESLGMAAVIVPPRAGVLSAVGLLQAPRQVDLVRSWPTPRRYVGLSDALASLAVEGAGVVSAHSGGGGVVETECAVDCRYAGQSHEITVAAVDDFEAEHERRNGYRRPGTAIEVVALRATARVAAPPLSLPIPDRRPAKGPCVLAEPDCTVWVPEGWRAHVHPTGSWVLTR